MSWGSYIANNGTGKGAQAIEWALDSLADSPAITAFLRDWKNGDVSAWPEYMQWLKEEHAKNAEHTKWCYG